MNYRVETAPGMFFFIQKMVGREHSAFLGGGCFLPKSYLVHDGKGGHLSLVWRGSRRTLYQFSFWDHDICSYGAFRFYRPFGSFNTASYHYLTS